MHLLSETAVWNTTSEFVMPDGMITKALGKSSIEISGDVILNKSWAKFGDVLRENDYRITVISPFEYRFESINPALGIQRGVFSIDRNVIYSRFRIEQTEMSGFEIIIRNGKECNTFGALYEKEKLINTWRALMKKEP